ncbi:MAG: glutaredoxin family protein [Myxococcaceae bacterium]|nr:glutaredoxin family protein [Myxococcaceae bacterium]
MTLLLAIALAASPLQTAKAHLDKGQLDELPFDFEGQTLKAAEKAEAVKLLAAATQAALQKKDDDLALLLAQTALKLEPKSPVALEAAGRAAFSHQAFEMAERYTDAWLSVEPSSGAAHQLRAELAAEAGEWDRVLQHTKDLDSPGARALRARAEREKTQRADAITSLKGFEKALAEARKNPLPKSEAPRPMAEARTSDVVLYSTSWCQYCKTARQWLTRKGVSFTERDIETDPDAMRELAQKAAAAGVEATGVPVIDVKGKLIVGFDASAIEQAM